MNRLWITQVGAVLRLEIRKSFLSRRGWWIYLLALLPFLMFAGHALQVKLDGERARRMHTEGTTAEKLRQIENGMKVEDLKRLLPNPADSHRYENRRGEHEWFEYSDGEHIVIVNSLDGEVDRIIRRGAVCDPAEDNRIFAGVFQFMYLRLFIFFGCMFVFMNLFRGEILDKSLHFYFLAPLRREVLVAGKFLAGFTATATIFGLSTIGQLALLYGHWTPEARAQFMTGTMVTDSLAYVGVTALACLGYGAVFLMAGMLIRNPLIPAAIILLWESINGILPATLRHISVIYYLKSLCPVDVPMGQNTPPPLALLASNVDPAGPVVAIGGLLLLASVVLAHSMYRARKMEISYGSD
ncbi:MAG TPA: hypothetical protein VGL53_17705 [Bryobacteraceae bacterium]|jgi:hypothetical protein